MVKKKAKKKGKKKGVGAPTVYGSDARNTTFRLSAVLHNRLKKEAKLEKRTVSDLINSILCPHFSVTIDGKKAK